MWASLVSLLLLPWTRSREGQLPLLEERNDLRPPLLGDGIESAALKVGPAVNAVDVPGEIWHGHRRMRFQPRGQLPIYAARLEGQGKHATGWMYASQSHAPWSLALCA